MPRAARAIVSTASAAAIRGGVFDHACGRGGVIALPRRRRLSRARYPRERDRIGAVATPMSNHYRDEFVRKMYEEAIPLGHVGEADDVAYAALYLASDEARFVTGHALVVDGGKSIRG
jgi:3-oxoacyl-[acyl-carrier protein] reductase